VIVRVRYDYIELLEVANLSFSTRTGLMSRQRHDCGGGLREPKSGFFQIRCGSQSDRLTIRTWEMRALLGSKAKCEFA
jgi:hypothetical protein